jgi:hypothetical protein
METRRALRTAWTARSSTSGVKWMPERELILEYSGWSMTWTN